MIVLKNTVKSIGYIWHYALKHIEKSKTEVVMEVLQLMELEIETAASTTNPLLDESGQFVKPEEAVRNFSTLWKQWDIVGKFFEKLPTLIIAAALVLVGIWLSRFVSKLAVRAMKAKNVDATIYNFISRVISTVIKLIFILSALSMFIKITSILAAFGAVGVAIGLGLQDSVAQIASGVQILMSRPFKNGDYVEVNGLAGNVAEIRFMNTIITTIDNKRIIIPNSDLTKNRIINYSAEEKRRVDLTFSVGYGDDIAKAKAVILETAMALPQVLHEPAPGVFVNAQCSSSIELIAKLWCKTEDYWDIYYAMQENVKLAFDKNGVNIPFDQLDVHIVGDSSIK